MTWHLAHPPCPRTTGRLRVYGRTWSPNNSSCRLPVHSLHPAKWQGSDGASLALVLSAAPQHGSSVAISALQRPQGALAFSLPLQSAVPRSPVLCGRRRMENDSPGPVCTVGPGSLAQGLATGTLASGLGIGASYHRSSCCLSDGWNCRCFGFLHLKRERDIFSGSLIPPGCPESRV